MPDPKPILNPLARDLLLGLGRIGARAIASAAKSAAKDARTILGNGDERLRNFIDGVEDVIRSSGDDGDDAGQKK